VSSIRDGVSATDDGLDAVRDGDQEVAGQRFRDATAEMASARGATRAWWSLPARHVPLVAPQVAALDAIADIGRESAAELQGIRSAAPPAPRMLAEAATGADGRVDLAEAVAPLVATARRGGAQVSTMLDVRTDPSPQDVALLLRVVREGLANAMRHAPGSEVTLEVVVDATRVTVAVGNGPAGRVPGQDVPVTTSVGLGLGLRGLRELITERGGELATSSDGDHHELRADYPTSSTARPVVLP